MQQKNKKTDSLNNVDKALKLAALTAILEHLRHKQPLVLWENGAVVFKDPVEALKELVLGEGHV